MLGRGIDFSLSAIFQIGYPIIEDYNLSCIVRENKFYLLDF